MKVGVVDYGCGNIKSISNMLDYIGVDSDIVCNPEALDDFDCIILPGVGSFDHGMKNIRESGFKEKLDQRARDDKPILGICLGMQLMTAKSEEGVEPGLGWFSSETKKISPFDIMGGKLLVPHMGWDFINEVGSNRYFSNDARFYFVHSYYVDGEGTGESLASCTYGGRQFSCAIKKGNLVGVQFHPEKSHHFGVSFFKQYFNLLGHEHVA